mmetsp:Transcript_11113/g.10772  ORF Transcript_11113/g.10772 Transcript_11113/m.10772 type:complete len:120 (+) Transcript_11113:249-608(+)
MIEMSMFSFSDVPFLSLFFFFFPQKKTKTNNTHNKKKKKGSNEGKEQHYSILYSIYFRVGSIYVIEYTPVVCRDGHPWVGESVCVPSNVVVVVVPDAWRGVDRRGVCTVSIHLSRLRLE